MTEKEIREYANETYMKVFSEIDDFINFVKEDTRTYINYDDYINNYYYISSAYRLVGSETTFRFYIKKNWLNCRIEVRTDADVENNRYTERFVIYRDILFTKCRNQVTKKIKIITSEVDFNVKVKKMCGNILLVRKFKIDKIKERFGY